MAEFETKDSGVRAAYDSGMVRDTQAGKARFDLLLPQGVPYADQMLTRDAMLMARGADKYGERNWEKANGQPELDRYHSSALRHLMQWIGGETDEDHAAAVRFNIMAGEYVKRRLVRRGPFETFTPPVEPPWFNCGDPACSYCPRPREDEVHRAQTAMRKGLQVERE